MELYNSELDTLISNICNRNIPQSMALNLGNYVDLYCPAVRSAMITPSHRKDVGEGYDEDFYGIRKKYVAVNHANSNIPVSYTLDLPKTHAFKWMGQKCLCCPKSSKVGSPEYYVTNFKTYLEDFTINTYDDLLDMYNSLSDFYYDYASSTKLDSRNVTGTELTKFLVEDILTTILNATKTLYQVWKTPTEFEFYSDIFDNIEKLIKLTQIGSRTNVNEFAAQLCNFYDKYKLDKNRLCGCPGKTDILIAYMLTKYNNDELTKDLVSKLERYKLGKFFESDLSLTGDSFYDRTSDVSVVSDDMSGISKDDITFFGNVEVVNDLGERGLENLKYDLMKFTPEMISNYIDTKNSRVIFEIDDQLKMYLKAELDCKMIIVNIRKNSFVTMLTILHYENDNFVLFKLSEDHDTLYGLSINEDPSNKERRLISIDKDEDLTFQFVINLDE